MHGRVASLPLSLIHHVRVLTILVRPVHTEARGSLGPQDDGPGLWIRKTHGDGAGRLDTAGSVRAGLEACGGKRIIPPRE